MVFVLVVSGFVISEIWSEWQVTNAYLSFLPDLVINSLSIKNKFLSGLVQGTINFAIVPFSIWLLPYFLSGSARLTISFKDYLLRYGIAFIPIIAAAHIGKSILKSTSRVPYFEHVSDDFSGISTAQKLISGQITLQENPTWIGSLISLLLIGFMIIGIWLSVKVVTRLNIKNGIKKAHKSYYLIPIIYGGIFLIMLLVWKWI
jgi:hypothetical protein